jgi:glycerol-3-phosphate dehydrogenase (NAD(P)+)
MSPAATRAAVLGGGAWGTTFAMVLADAGCEVTVWTRDDEVCEQICEEHCNSSFLGSVRLPDAVGATTDARAATHGADLVAVALPAQVAASALEPLAGAVGPDAVAVSLMKGVELATFRRMSEVVGQALGLPPERMAAVSGPNLAHEIAERQPTATVVASVDDATAQRVARAVASSYFRPYTTSDVVGVELCGAVKNVIAIAVGIAQGRGLGYNTRATLITRGLVEITRLGLKLGAEAATFNGLAGMGDLAATCSSPASRNHALGVHFGRGASLDEALAAARGTTEGVNTSRAVRDLARSLGVEMPITEAVVDALFEGLPLDEMAPRLLGRPMKSEALDRPV